MKTTFHIFSFYSTYLKIFSFYLAMSTRYIYLVFMLKWFYLTIVSLIFFSRLEAWVANKKKSIDMRYSRYHPTITFEHLNLIDWRLFPLYWRWLEVNWTVGGFVYKPLVCFWSLRTHVNILISCAQEIQVPKRKKWKRKIQELGEVLEGFIHQALSNLSLP